MTDLTVGKPWTVLWKFSLPMFVSVIFQQMYSIFDSIIAGKFAGEDALAAVGASYPITMIFMDFCMWEGKCWLLCGDISILWWKMSSQR